MKIGIMQPYFLPYIGYFALINAVDKFVYFDNVQYIRRGWVNRNRVKMKNKWLYITLPIKKAPLSATINEIYIVDDQKAINKIKETIKHGYSKAPNYEIIKKFIFKHISPGLNLSELNINLTNEICDYLVIKTEMLVSSKILNNNSMSGTDKIINTCQFLGGHYYVNPIGGLDLYPRKKFQESNIQLGFLKINGISYSQGQYEFIPNLSILDVLMWNSKEEINNMLTRYEIIKGID